MSGYAASARIDRASPRLARSARASEPVSRPPSSAVTVDLVEWPAGGATAAPAGPVPDGTSVGDRIAAIRERWSQLTFFLFDANSWRT